MPHERLEIDIEGDVAERADLLNGSQSVTLAGADATQRWTAVLSFSWNVGLVDDLGEGDLTLTRDDGSELFATLASAQVHDAPEGDADHAFALNYDVDGGDGAYADAAGSATVVGTLAGDLFRARVSIGLALP